MSADFSVRYAGSITLLCPMNAEASAWLAHVIPRACVVLDSRQALEILAAIKGDGLSVIERNEFEGARARGHRARAARGRTHLRRP